MNLNLSALRTEELGGHEKQQIPLNLAYRR